MDRKRPIGITFIGYFYIFGAIVLLIALFTNARQQIGIAVRFGVPNVPERVMILLVVPIFLLIAYGYLSLKKWGYWSMMIYTLYFLLVSIGLSVQYRNQLFYGNVIFSITVIIYTLSKRTYFDKVKFLS